MRFFKRYSWLERTAMYSWLANTDVSIWFVETPDDMPLSLDATSASSTAHRALKNSNNLPRRRETVFNQLVERDESWQPNSYLASNFLLSLDWQRRSINVCTCFLGIFHRRASLFLNIWIIAPLVPILASSWQERVLTVNGEEVNEWVGKREPCRSGLNLETISVASNLQQKHMKPPGNDQAILWTILHHQFDKLVHQFAKLSYMLVFSRNHFLTE